MKQTMKCNLGAAARAAAGAAACQGVRCHQVGCWLRIVEFHKAMGRVPMALFFCLDRQD